MAPDAPSARPSANTGLSSSVSSQSLNQIYPPKSMGPEPNDAAVRAMLASTSWKITSPLRGTKLILRKCKTFGRLMGSGEFGKIYTILRPNLTQAKRIAHHPAIRAERAEASDKNDIVIIATHHTLYVAYCLAASLMSYGFEVTIRTDVPEHWGASLYFVVCAQMFETLPPADRRICVQLEQTVMSRWFTDRYNSVLRESLAVIEYTQNGIKFLDGLGISYPKVYYMPIGAMADYTNYLRTKGQHLVHAEKEYDVVFYGDLNNTRRRSFIAELSRHFNVLLIGNTFGIDLYNEIVKAKVCVNIHYYENASLESTRIFEALSLRMPVVSELSLDQADYDFSAYGDSIQFTEVGNIDAMVAAVRLMIEEPRLVPVLANRKSANNFHFYVGRLLLGLDKISFRRLYSQCERSDIVADKIVLSLPETFERRAVIKAAAKAGIYCFPGLRARPGWVGAAFSFKYLAKKLLESGCEFVLIHEDDAVFPSLDAQEILDFAKKIYNEYYKWDVFSAFISDLHNDAKISKIFSVDGIECVATDRTVGMVCNVYSRKSLEIIAQWDENDLDVHTNTIDRYLENMEELKVVTTIPFLAEHNDMANSSMWGVKNYTMRNMINNSRTLLFEKVWTLKASDAVAEYVDDRSDP
ncbi:CgeB family protein [Asaia bogorensis]|uniref:hypothetical protein n=3 Tax=Asaia bogorensis TaxID=91915 RepID=UPI0014951CF7|nr:hypothetical protein [Asaia bogorensis]